MTQHYEMDFDDVEEAFNLGIITFDQFIDIMNDNFGWVITKQIIKKTMKELKRDEGREKRAKMIMGKK